MRWRCRDRDAGSNTPNYSRTYPNLVIQFWIFIFVVKNVNVCCNFQLLKTLNNSKHFAYSSACVELRGWWRQNVCNGRSYTPSPAPDHLVSIWCFVERNVWNVKCQSPNVYFENVPVSVVELVAWSWRDRVVAVAQVSSGNVSRKLLDMFANCRHKID